jgi:Zn-dependent protease
MGYRCNAAPLGRFWETCVLLSYWDRLLADPERFIPIILIVLLALLMAITVHEFSHAAVALALGDDTAKRQGRVTLNPIAHLDPVGSLMILFVGFGWGKPVPFSPWRFRANPRLSSSMVALAGPMSNFATAVALASAHRAGWRPPELLYEPIQTLFSISLLLGVFNLFPIFPLDGFNVVRGLLPAKLGDEFARLAPWGPGILFALIGIGLFTDFNPLSMLLLPLVNAIAGVLLGTGRL